MLINKTRIRNLTPYINSVMKGSKIIIAISISDNNKAILSQMGFGQEYQIGESILPSAGFGPISKYNAEGKYLIHKDQQMETCYRQVLWHWTEFHGRNTRVEQSKIVDVPYKRYPRTFIEPPSIELTISLGPDGRTLIISPEIEKKIENIEILTHTVNLFLEIFGECEILTNNLDEIIKPNIQRLNWEILPKGEIPWEKSKEHIKSLVKEAPEGNQVILLHRLKTISEESPDFMAIGKGGFHGYIVHGFSSKDLFIFESLYYGNTTYIFGGNWKSLSQLTKAEILNNKFQKDRIVHTKGWERKIANLLHK